MAQSKYFLVLLVLFPPRGVYRYVWWLWFKPLENRLIGCTAVLEKRLFESNQAPFFGDQKVVRGYGVLDSSPDELNNQVLVLMRDQDIHMLPYD